MNNIERGKLGENKVSKYIEQAIKIATIEAEVIENVILEFPSLYGRNGKMTTEIDHIIITPYYVYLIETKNEIYKKIDYEEKEWKLQYNDKPVSNPLVQNRMHKNVFCSEFKIDREKVITVECLLGYSKLEITSQYPNDYIFTEDNFVDNMALLLISTSDSLLDNVSICQRLKVKEQESDLLRSIHIENIEKAEEIENWTYTHEKHFIFARTDTAICPKCGGILLLKRFKGIDYQRGNERKSLQYMIGCINYKRDNTGCGYAVYYSQKREQGFDSIVKTKIEEKNGWNSMEENRTTVLDEYIQQKNLIQNLQTENKRLGYEIKHIKEENCKQIRNITKERNDAINNKEKLEQQYTHILGPLYIKNDKIKRFGKNK